MKVYVAYIATDGGRDAVALGEQIARSMNAELAIGMVVPLDRVAAVTGGSDRETLTERAEQWLAAARAFVPDDIVVTTHVSFSDSAAEGIVAQAERIGAAAVVVGATGGGLLGRFWLGSVVNELIHFAPTALVLAPRGYRHFKVERIRSLTCAVGSRPGAGAVLNAAVLACERAGLPLRLVSLVAFDQMAGHDPTDAEAVQQARRHAEGVLEAARTRLPDKIEVTATVAVGLNVEDAVEQLEWHTGDVILVGSARLAAPRRLFMGSTAAKMLRTLDVPMVIVPREARDEH